MRGNEANVSKVVIATAAAAALCRFCMFLMDQADTSRGETHHTCYYCLSLKPTQSSVQSLTYSPRHSFTHSQKEEVAYSAGNGPFDQQRVHE